MHIKSKNFGLVVLSMIAPAAALGHHSFATHFDFENISFMWSVTLANRKKDRWRLARAEPDVVQTFRRVVN